MDCPICYEMIPLMKAPNCNHLFCSICISKITKCALCRTDFNIEIEKENDTQIIIILMMSQYITIFFTNIDYIIYEIIGLDLQIYSEEICKEIINNYIEMKHNGLSDLEASDKLIELYYN